MKLASGVDIIEIERVGSAIQRHGERFLRRIFTPAELTEARDSPASLAARFAAKEAAAKALGTGIGVVSWHEIEVLSSAGQPNIHLHGAARSLAQTSGLQVWSVSLSHSMTHAVAMVVALGD